MSSQSFSWPWTSEGGRVKSQAVRRFRYLCTEHMHGRQARVQGDLVHQAQALGGDNVDLDAVELCDEEIQVILACERSCCGKLIFIHVRMVC